MGFFKRSDSALLDKMEACYYMGLSVHYRMEIADRVPGYIQSQDDYLRWAKENALLTKETLAQVDPRFLQLLDTKFREFTKGRSVFKEADRTLVMQEYNWWVFRQLQGYASRFLGETSGREEPREGLGKDSFYDIARNKFNGEMYHVSTMPNPVVGYWETAVFSHPGPGFGGTVKRGDTILTPEFVSKAAVNGVEEERLADLARLGPEGTHKLVRNRVANEDPNKWTMTSDELERYKQFVLDLMDRREAK